MDTESEGWMSSAMEWAIFFEVLGVALLIASAVAAIIMAGVWLYERFGPNP